MLNTLGMPLQAEFFFYGSFLSEQNENLLYVQLEPLAGQEERCTLGTTLLRDESVPGITAGTGCTFISLSLRELLPGLASGPTACETEQ